MIEASDGAAFVTIADGLFRLKDIVSIASGYHWCLNCNFTYLYSILFSASAGHMCAEKKE